MKYKLYKLSLISLCLFLLGFSRFDLPHPPLLAKTGSLWIQKRLASSLTGRASVEQAKPVLSPSQPATVKAVAGGNRLPQAPILEEVAVPDTSLIRLLEFIETVKDERKKGLIVGVFVANILASPVVQQPADNLLYVSAKQNTLTQFRRAKQAGSIGLLAHNYLAGAQFFNIKMGTKFYVINWDGSYRAYEVYAIEDYQAITTTSFRDLATQKAVGQYPLFNRIYRSEDDRVVFQTCIERNGNPSWGRRFILAKPVLEEN